MVIQLKNLIPRLKSRIYALTAIFNKCSQHCYNIIFLAFKNILLKHNIIQKRVQIINTLPDIIKKDMKRQERGKQKVIFYILSLCFFYNNLYDLPYVYTFPYLSSEALRNLNPMLLCSAFYINQKAIYSQTQTCLFFDQCSCIG